MSVFFSVAIASAVFLLVGGRSWWGPPPRPSKVLKTVGAIVLFVGAPSLVLGFWIDDGFFVITAFAFGCVCALPVLLFTRRSRAAQ